MFLPDYVLECINALERSGFAAYAVGGCVRDACLGLTPQDYDLCTSALPEQTEAVFSDRRLILAGKKHGTVGVVTGAGVVEITTFRTEGDYADNRHPGWVKFVPDIESDLARRDFTVNAMAYSPYRGFADPFGGRADLESRTLRAVGCADARFREDSLRILRGLRFSVKYRLTVEDETLKAMFDLAHLMENLARERVFDELCKLLLLADARDLLRFVPILAAVIPELKPMIGFDQRSPYHAYDLFTHTAQVTGSLPAQLPLRWAGLLHDTGKIATFTIDENGRGHFYGHASVSAEIADRVLRRLKAPNQLREQVCFLIGKHMTPLAPDKKLLRRRIAQYGMENVLLLFQIQQSDFGGKGTHDSEENHWFQRIDTLLQAIQEEDSCLSLKDLAVNGRDLMALGYSGREIGEKLQQLLELVIDEAVPNAKDALLNAAKKESI
ncbi:MAG: HD domain-containing protein [Oscillospiraceae bacterium]|nr:HD domain-containing protein [Oscillospiraceae bacterium]